MADQYEPKVYKNEKGDRLTLESGGELNFLSGSKVLNDGTQAAAIADVAAADPSAAPAGGTGATAGAYDTAGNRDLAITAINDNRTLTIELSDKLDLVLAAIRGAGILVP